MASQFGWMDHDEAQRRRMLAAIELFKDEGTVDELGVGAVRDTIAGALFPGVSVLHTRARYLLFVPWCVAAAAHTGRTVDDALKALRANEIKVLYALLDGDSDQSGLIGRVAKHNLKRLPSSAYWSVLHRWGIRHSDTTITGYLRDAKIVRQIARRTPASDDPEVSLMLPGGGFDPNLPPPPSDFATPTSFALAQSEAGYLADRWRMSTAGSLLPWVLDYGTAAADDIWLHPSIETAPAELQELLEHGRRLGQLSYGAALLYNLLLAERFDEQDNRDLKGLYRNRLKEWNEAVRAERTAEQWDLDRFWVIIGRYNSGIVGSTRTFVNRWVDAVSSTSAVADDDTARRLVENRERSIKGGRARLANPSALQRWSGASGLVQMDFNWRVTKRLADDILAGLGA